MSPTPKTEAGQPATAAERKARLTSAQHDAVLRAMQDSVLVLDPSGVILDLNEAGFWDRARRQGLLGHDRTELAHACTLSELDGREVPFDNRPTARILRGEVLTDWVLRARLLSDKEDSILSFSGELVRDEQGAPTLGVLVTRDITRRHRAEEKLIAERERLATTLQSIGDAVVVTDERGQVTMLNSVAEQLTGWNSALALGKPLRDVFQIVNEGTRAPMKSPVDRVLVDGRKVALENHTVLISRDGTERVVADSGAPIHDGAGNVSGVVMIVRDQTEKHRAAQALQQSEDKFRGLVEQSLTGIYLLQDGRFRYVNPRFAEIFGYGAPAALIDTVQISDLVAPESREQVAAKITARITGAETESHYTFTGLRGDGRKIEVEVHGRSVQHEGRPAVIGAAVDITEARRRDAQVRQAQKLDSIGRLAGGIAHDFGNLLTVAYCYLESLQDAADASRPPSSIDLRELKTALDRGLGLTKQLLAFASKQDTAPRPVDVNVLVQDSLRLLGRVLGKDLRLLHEPAPELWPVFCDPGQLEQVLLNLAVNARDAMPHGGSLSFCAANVEVDDVRPPVASLRAGGWVRLTVRDTGSGMPPEVQAHLFEPFFTTKTASGGTGLGLATVHGIVTKAGGVVQVESAPGSGTAFHVWLPRAPAL
jgi:PAS domain S-box-containing protein